MPELISMGGLTVAVEQPAHPTRPPILLLHGLLGGACDFENYGSFFATRGHPVHALNLRGHHGSRPVADMGRVSVTHYVSDALEVARALARGQTGATRTDSPPRSDDTRPVAIGHSLGGLLAQKLAEAGAVRAAVLVCSAPPRGIPVANVTLFRRQLKYLLPLLRSRALAGTLADSKALILNRVPEAEHEALHARLVPGSGRAGREVSLGAIAVDERRVTCPVLVVAARDDRFMPAYVARKLASKYRAPLFEYPDHGHFILREPGWEGPAADIAAWLERSAPT